MKAYIASGWFNDAQENARIDIITACNLSDIKVYSPKDDFLYVQGKTDPQEVFDTNIKEIKNSDFVIASTVDKDMGTIFECGVSFMLNKPIIYYWPNGTGPFNLMLAQTAYKVCVSFYQLVSYLTIVKNTNAIPTIPYKGDIE